MKSIKTVTLAAALIVGATSLAMAQVGAPNPSGNSGSGGPRPASAGPTSDTMQSNEMKSPSTEMKKKEMSPGSTTQNK